MRKDSLTLVAACYYLSALGVALVAWLPSIYLVVTLLMAPSSGGELKLPNGFGGLEGIFLALGSALWILLWGVVIGSSILTALLVYTARCLRIRQRLLLCQLMSLVIMVTGPVGIVIGIFSLVKLSNPEIKEQFQR